MTRTALLVFLLVVSSATSAFADQLRGRVVDPQDRPIAGAHVLVLRGGTIAATSTTSRDGRFGPITLPPGNYDVTVSAPGLRVAPRSVSIAQTGIVDLDLKLELAAVSEAVVVSASQIDRPLSRVTDSVTIIDKVGLEARQTETATEALRLVPGFSLVASGGRGALTSIFPRGGESDFTLVMVDGIALNAFGGGFDAAHLSTAGVDRIEVVRGPQSAIFGGGAIGGIVNVVTRSGGPTRGQALAEAGGQGFGRITASAAGSRQAWSWGAAFERAAADGDTSQRASIGRRVSNDDYERLLGSFSGGWSDRATRRIRIDARFSRNERGFPGPYGSDPSRFYGGLDTVSRGINRARGLGGAATFGDPRTLQHHAQLSWSTAPSRYLSPYGESDDRTRRLTARYQIDVERDPGGLSAGLEVQREQADNTFITGNLFQPVPVTRVLSGWFAEVRRDAGRRASVTAGLRLERIERSALEANPSPFGGRPAFGKDVVWSLNPKISAAFFVRGDRTMNAATGWTRVRAGAGTGIKPPTAFEIAFTDNPSLKPERSRSIDAGVEHVFPGALVSVDATWFANRYEDLIVSVGGAYTGASRYRTDNIANARAAGLELGVRWQGVGGLSARAAYTRLSTEVLGVDNVPGQAPFPFRVGDRLPRRAPNQGSLEVRYEQARGRGFLLVSGRGATTDLEPNYGSSLFTSDGHIVVTTGASVRVSRNLEAYGRVANLLGRSYEDALGYPAPGRLVTAGLRVALGR